MTDFVRRVFHPTDGSPASEPAFAHALAIALARRASLTILNAQKTPRRGGGRRFPQVRETLEQWGLLGPGAEQAEVYERLGVKVRKVGIESSHPTEAIRGFLRDHPADLMVVAADGREGRQRFLHGSVVRRAARAAGLRTLFVPGDSEGFVSPGDGRLSLRRILVPLASNPEPRAALDMATRVADALGDPPVEIQVLHVGESMPAVELPAGEAWSFSSCLRSGAVVDGILDAAREFGADLIVMATQLRDGLLGALRGRHLERVVQAAPCPLAAIPPPGGAGSPAPGDPF